MYVIIVFDAKNGIMNLEKADFPNLEVVFFFHFVKDRDCSDFCFG